MISGRIEVNYNSPKFAYYQKQNLKSNPNNYLFSNLVISNTLPSTNVLSTINRVNQSNQNTINLAAADLSGSDLYQPLPQPPISQTIGEPKRFPEPPGLSNMPLNNSLPGSAVRHSQHNPLEKESVPLYQSFSAQSSLPNLKPTSSPVYVKQNVTMRNPAQPSDNSLLHSSPLLGGFVDLPQQQGYGVIGQNVRVVPAVQPMQTMYPISVQRPALPPAPDLLREAPSNQNLIPEGHLSENRVRLRISWVS